MAYETKVLLTALAEHIKSKKQYTSDEKELHVLKDLYKYVAKMANVEGVVLEPFDADDE